MRCSRASTHSTRSSTHFCCRRRKRRAARPKRRSARSWPASAGIRTTSHSKICENLVRTEDAATAAKLYQAGGVLLGKLATHEFAHGGPSFDLPWGDDCDPRGAV